LKAHRDETDFRNTQGPFKALHQREDQGEHELYYFDESGFSQSSSVPYAWSPIGKPCEVPAYSHSRRLNVRQMKYAWLPLSAYLSFDNFCDEVHRLLDGYGTECAINFE
jgi:hypothetical protein